MPEVQEGLLFVWGEVMKITEVTKRPPMDVFADEPSRYAFPSHEVNLTIEGYPLPRFDIMIGIDLYIMPLDVVEGLSDSARDEIREKVKSYNEARRASEDTNG